MRNRFPWPGDDRRENAVRSGGCLLVVLILVATAQVARGALATGAPEVPAPRLKHDGARLFDLRGLRQGDRAERCLRFVNDGEHPVAVGVFGTGRDAGLAKDLRLDLRRGCDGGELLWSGSMRSFPEEERAVADPLPVAAGEERGYGLAVEVVGEPAPRAALTQTFAVGAVTAADQRAESVACTTLKLGAGAKRGTLTKRARLRGRIDAKLIVQVLGRGADQRLILVTGLRVGKRVLAGGSWARVTYAIDGRRVATPRRRPFKAKTLPGDLAPGTRTITARVTPNRGRPIRVGFVLKITADAATKTCTVG